MSDPQYGRPRAAHPAVTPISALENTPQDPRSLERQRLLREEAKFQAEARRQAELARGVIYVVMGLLGFVLLLDLLMLARGQSSALTRVIGGILILYGIYTGKSWSRLVLVVLMGLTALIAVPTLGPLFQLSPMLGMVMLLVLGLYAGSSVALFMPPAKYHFENN